MITSDTAQLIVGRTMEILPYNINVIRPDGTIIGSGDAARIGTMHEAARIVKEKGDIVEITKEEEQCWEGAVQGINLPAFLNGELEAVIGITGPPEDVRSFGRLVVMTAEMMMEQAVLLREMQVDERMREETALLLLDAAQPKDAVQDRLDRLHISLDTPRTVLCFTDPEPERLRHSLQPILHQDELLCIRKGRLLAVVRAESESALRQRFGALSSYPTAIGPDAEPDDLPKAADLAWAAASLPHQDDRFLFYRHVDLEVLLYQSRLHDLPGDSRPLGGELTQTLKAYLAHDGSLKQTAEALHIHRNTLQYRLDRIRTISGRDPRRLKDLLYLYARMLRSRG